MELFTKLSEIMGEGCTLAINIAKTKDGMTVSVLPGNSLVKDAAKNKITPLNICGSAEELDEGFVEAIVTPIASTNKMLVDMKSYEDGQAAAKAASEMEKKAKESAKKNADVFAKWMTLAEQNESEDKLKDARTCALKAIGVSDGVTGGKAKAEAFIKKINEKADGGLFGAFVDKSNGENITIEN